MMIEIADLCLPKTSGILLAHITHLWARVDSGPWGWTFACSMIILSKLSLFLSSPNPYRILHPSYASSITSMAGRILSLSQFRCNILA